MTKIDELVNRSVERIIVELNKKENKEKMNCYVLDPIVRELGAKFEPYIFIIIVMYILIVIPLFLLLLISLLKRKK